MCIYMYVCVYIYIYIFTHAYIHVHIGRQHPRGQLRLAAGVPGHRPAGP